MEQEVARFIARHRLLNKPGLHIVALSGGADSVALLRVLLSLGYRVEAAHCNFHLRGEESERDEQFVVSLCKQLGVAIHRVHFDTQEYATLHKVSIEMAARQLRYRYFEQLRQDISAETICVAHHRNDAVETLLMNLLRGAGIHGLTGIRPKNGNIVRPLLCVSRQQIVSYLDTIGQPYVTDSTNLMPDVLRNKIRLQLIPLLQELSPAASEQIHTTALHLAEAERVYDDAIRRQSDTVLTPLPDEIDAIDIDLLQQMPSPESLLHELLLRYGFTSATADQVSLQLAMLQPGRCFESTTHRLVVDRRKLLIEPLSEEVKEQRLPEPGNYVLSDGHRLRLSVVTPPIVSRQSEEATLDADKVRFPLTVRPACQGDRFQPYGMKGTQLVSDYLTNRKRSLIEKRRQLVVCDASGAVVWLVGERTDGRFAVDRETVRTLLLSYTTQ